MQFICIRKSVGVFVPPVMCCFLFVLDLNDTIFLFPTAELEFIQIIIIIVVITVMIVVIICLLNHYKGSTRSFISRQSQSRRQEDSLQPVSLNFYISLSLGTRSNSFVAVCLIFFTWHIPRVL